MWVILYVNDLDLEPNYELFRKQYVLVCFMVTVNKYTNDDININLYPFTPSRRSESCAEAAG